MLLPQISALLARADLSVRDLEEIAYIQGPGSFTGLRIGLSCALALAFSRGIKLRPLPMFALYATRSTLPYAIVILDARLQQIYVAAIEVATQRYIIEPCLLDPQQLPELVRQTPLLRPEVTQLGGPGIASYADKLGEKFLSAYPQRLDSSYPAAGIMLQLAQNEHFVQTTPEQADLLYLRNKVALNQEEQQQCRSKN